MIYVEIGVVLFVVVLIIGAFVIRREESLGWFDAFGETAGVAVFSSGVTTITLLIVMQCLCELDQVRYESEFVPLVAVKSDDVVEGSFIFGCGSVGKKHKYRFFESHDGVVRAQEVSASSAGIREDSNPTNARVERVYKVKQLSENSWKRRWKLGTLSHRPYYWDDLILHVPPGTVVKQFNVE